MFAWKSSPESGRHLETLLHSKTRGYYYQNPEADLLIDAYFVALDPKKRQEAWADIQLMVVNEAPWVFLWQQHDLYGVANWVEWQPRADEKVWMFEAKIAKK